MSGEGGDSTKENVGQTQEHVLWHAMAVAMRKCLKRGSTRKIAENAPQAQVNNVANNHPGMVSDVDVEAGLGKCLGGKIPENTYQAQDNNMTNRDPWMVSTKIPHEVKNKKNIAAFLTGLCIAVLLSAIGFKLLEKGNSVFMWATIGSSYVGTLLGFSAINMWEWVNNRWMAPLKLAEILNYIITVLLVLSISFYPMAAIM